MPRAGALKGTGKRTYICESCGEEERLPYAGIGFETACRRCGSPCYSEPFPTAELIRRLAAAAARLEAEDGPLGRAA